MPRVKVGPALPDARTLDIEIARLRDLDIGGLQVRWQNVFRRRPPPHLPRHLLFRALAYQLQADRLGDLDAESQRLLDATGSPEDAGKRAVETPDFQHCRPSALVGCSAALPQQAITRSVILDAKIALFADATLQNSDMLSPTRSMGRLVP